MKLIRTDTHIKLIRCNQFDRIEEQIQQFIKENQASKSHPATVQFEVWVNNMVVMVTCYEDIYFVPSKELDALKARDANFA